MLDNNVEFLKFGFFKENLFVRRVIYLFIKQKLLVSQFPVDYFGTFEINTIHRNYKHESRQ